MTLILFYRTSTGIRLKLKRIDEIAELGHTIVISIIRGACAVPNIRPSAYLRNNYNGISDFCHSSMEPVFITKNGHGDLAVMSIEVYEKLCGRNELYYLLDQSIEAEKAGDFVDYDTFITEFQKEMT